MTWTQQNPNITGFIINRNENDGPLAEVARLEKTMNNWIDNNITGGRKYGYILVAYAAENQSNKLEVNLTPITGAYITSGASATNISHYSATISGNVTGDGGAAVTERGICYSRTQNPTISDIKIPSGTGTGEFNTILNGLSANTTYYARAYAVNSQGVTYGSQITFVTLSDIGNFTYEGKTYSYKIIGTQIWMIENLAYLPGVSPPEQGNEKNAMYYVYDYIGSDTNVAKSTSKYSDFGALYNWEAARKACPPGWHLPSDDEWKTLEKYLGMSNADADALNERGETGNKLKASSVWWPHPSGIGGDNSSGFNAFPSGDRWLDGFFYNYGMGSFFWTATEIDASQALYRGLHFLNSSVGRWYNNKSCGFSVRCVGN